MDPATVLDRIDRHEYPWDPKVHPVDEQGHSMAYVDTGTGEPIVLVHGNPTWSYLWRNVIKGLEKKHRCIAPDLIGFGCSDKPHDADYYSLDRHIRNLGALIRHLDLDKVTLVVQDWGGPIGLGWAVRNPDKVARLVILNTWGQRPDGLMGIPWWYRLARSPGMGEILYLKHNVMVEKGIPQLIADKDKVTPELMDAYRAPHPFPDDRVGILRFVRMVPCRVGDECYDELGEIEAGLETLDVPVGIVWARKDPAFRKAIAHDLATKLPRGDPDRIVDLPDANHFLQEDDPESIVRETLRVMKQK